MTSAQKEAWSTWPDPNWPGFPKDYDQVFWHVLENQYGTIYPGFWDLHNWQFYGDSKYISPQELAGWNVKYHGKLEDLVKNASV